MTAAPPSGAGPSVAVVGAGVLGLMCAWRLAQQGARVTLYEAAPDRANASRIAAGMIAPATECALEAPLREVAEPLRAARDAWTSVARELGVDLWPVGTRHLGPPPLLDDREALLRGLGFRAPLPSHAPPGSGGSALVTDEDAVLSTAQVLPALRTAAAAAGVVFRARQVERDGGGFSSGGEQIRADVAVLATGAEGRASGLAPELARLTPIKGQLLRWNGGGQAGDPILRTPGLYLATLPGEVVAGATMEPGRDDLAPDPDLLAPIRAEAEALVPALRALGPPAIEVGVRADTPDGLPMVGPSALPGVVLATGARRNGWLWAPPIAALVVARVLGLPPGPLAPLADRLHPGRFDGREAR